MNNYFLTILLASTIIISSCGGEKPQKTPKQLVFMNMNQMIR